MAQQPDISQILAALAQQQSNGTPQAPTPQQQAPLGYPPGIPAQPPSAPPHGASYLPQPSNTGSVDLSAIRPVNSGSVSIADAIAKAKSIAAEKGMSPYDARQQSSTPRDDPRLAGRGYRRSRSRSPPRRDSYGANPYRDERREDARRSSYRRSPSPDRGFRGARDPPLSTRANEPDTETIRVKSSFVGLIIGRNGENLKKVEQDTGARVQFIQAKDSHVPERQCTISGSQRARAAAKAAIYGIIEENGGPNVTEEKGAYTAGMPGRAKPNIPPTRDGESTERVTVPDKTVGLIIGRGGETIKDLQERSGCHVNILAENKSENGYRPINLIGTDQSRAHAYQLIMEIVDSDSKGSGSGSGSGTNQTAAQRDRGFDNYGQQRGGGGGGGVGGGAGGRDYIEKTINVPSEAVGMIIGKGGETIKDMQKTTGCKINVNQPQGKDVTRKIDLAGNSRSMADAERIIWEKVETVRQRDAARGAGSGGGAGGGYDGYSQTQQASSVPGYAQYMQPTQAPPQMPAFQMPAMPAQQAAPQQSEDPYAAWGGQAAVMAWYQQQMANLGQQPPGSSGGAPGT